MSRAHRLRHRITPHSITPAIPPAAATAHRVPAKSCRYASGGMATTATCWNNEDGRIASTVPDSSPTTACLVAALCSHSGFT